MAHRLDVLLLKHGDTGCGNCCGLFSPLTWEREALAVYGTSVLSRT